MPTLQEYEGKYTITLPIDQIKQAGWKKGDDLSASFNERGNIELRKIEQKKK